MHVQLMTAAEVGAYTLLINYSWSEDGLPADLNDLADLARMDIETFTNSWNKRISKCFEFDEKKNKYFCPQLREQAKKQKEFRIKKSLAGIASGRKRREIKQLSDEHLFNSVRTDSEHTDERVFNSVRTNDEQKRTLHTSSSSSYSSSEYLKEKEKKIDKKKEKEKRSATPSAEHSSRGSRLPTDFTITEEMRAWAQREYPAVPIDLETDKFRDYWQSQSGSRGVKLDWQATWRNWIRNANDYTQQRRGNYGKPNTDHNGTYETTEQLIAGLGINARIIT